MADKVIRASAYGGTVRAFANDIKDTLGTAMGYHSLNPLAAVALGRALSAASMMGEMAKSKEDTVTMVIKGKGPMGGIVAVCSKEGTLKGYVVNNDYSSYGNCIDAGVGGCIGSGYLNIIRDLGMKEPYTGTIPLQSGEIGDDLAYYFTYSEQIPSLVALGVKLNPDMTVKSAAGMIIQLMPGADKEVIPRIEARLRQGRSVSNMMEKEKTPLGVLEFMMPDGDVQITGDKPVSFKCDCSRIGMLRGIASLGRDELEKIISEQDVVETTCHFCLVKYHFQSEEIKKLLEKQGTGLSMNDE
ncbi:MAG: Hsp33 family molecular chaperone HslO [Clostridia bacterium]